LLAMIFLSIEAMRKIVGRWCSLARLRRDCVDIFHLHNAITEAGGEEALSVRQAGARFAD
jgi:hypothetical protein